MVSAIIAERKAQNERLFIMRVSRTARPPALLADGPKPAT